MIGGLVSIAVPGVSVAGGEPMKPVEPGAAGFGAALALALPAVEILPRAVGESPTRPVGLPEQEAGDVVAAFALPQAAMPVPVADEPRRGGGLSSGPVIGGEVPVAEERLPVAARADVAVGEGAPLAMAGDGPVQAMARRRGVGGNGPVVARAGVAKTVVRVRAPEALAPGAAEVSTVGARPKAGGMAADLSSDAGDPAAAAVVAGELALPAVVLAMPAVPPAVVPGGAALERSGPSAVKVPPVEVAAAAAAMVEGGAISSLRVPDFVGVPVKSAGNRLLPDGVAVVDALLPARVIEAGRRDVRAFPAGLVSEISGVAQRVDVVLPLAPRDPAAALAALGDGLQRDFELVSAGEAAVPGGGGGVLPGVSGGNPLARGGVADGFVAAPVVSAAAEQRISVESDALGPVEIGVEGGGQDLRVRLSGSSAAAGVMAAEAPRLLAELAASGVRVQSLAFDGRVEPATETAAGQGGFAASAGQQGSGQQGFERGRPGAAAVRGLINDAAGGERPRTSERYA